MRMCIYIYIYMYIHTHVYVTFCIIIRTFVDILRSVAENQMNDY